MRNNGPTGTNSLSQQLIETKLRERGHDPLLWALGMFCLRELLEAGAGSLEPDEQRLWVSTRDPKESCRQWPVWDQECCFLQYAKLLISPSWGRWWVFLKKDSFKLIKTFQAKARDWEDMLSGLTPLLFFLERTEIRLQFITFLCNKFRRKMYSRSKEEQISPRFPLLELLLLVQHCNFPGFTPLYTHKTADTPTWQRVLVVLCLSYLSNLILQGCEEPFPLLILTLKASVYQRQERLLAQQGHALGEANTALH